MSYYTRNANFHGWGPEVVQLNPKKTQLLDQFAIGKILDIGCGSGIYAHYLQQKGYQVTAIDQQKQFIQQAQKKYKQVIFQQASALKLPFKNQSFDTAILFDILEHVDDVKVLQETTRVAKRVIISVPCTNQSFLTRWSLAHHHYIDKTHLREYTITSLKKLFHQVSLKPLYLQEALPISIYGLAVSHLSGDKPLKKFILKLILKPFTPEKPLYSTIFAVGEK